MPDITRNAPHTRAGYPPLPSCLPKLLGTRKVPQGETEKKMNCGQPANRYILKHTLEVIVFKFLIRSES